MIVLSVSVYGKLNQGKKMAKFSKIYIERDGVITDIRDLPREEYETVMDIFMSVRMAYIVLMDRSIREGKKLKTNEQ